MKQSKAQEKRLIIADLLRAYRDVAETKGFLSTLDDLTTIDSYMGKLETSLQCIKSVIQLVSDGGKHESSDTRTN